MYTDIYCVHILRKCFVIVICKCTSKTRMYVYSNIQTLTSARSKTNYDRNVKLIIRGAVLTDNLKKL